jgi:hypothetical protein
MKHNRFVLFSFGFIRIHANLLIICVVRYEVLRLFVLLTMFAVIKSRFWFTVNSKNLIHLFAIFLTQKRFDQD